MYKYIEDSFACKSLDTQILEPICVVFRLALLQYTEKGTKLSIHNNSIAYQVPSYNQGLLRSFAHDSREDLHNLYHPILKAIDWYPYIEYKEFYDECVKGLVHLNNTYDDKSMIRQTLSHYISVIQMNDSENYREDTEFNPIIDTLRDIWSPAEIKSTIHLLILIKNNRTNDIYSESLDTLLKSKEKKVNEYLTKIYS